LGCFNLPAGFFAERLFVALVFDPFLLAIAISSCLPSSALARCTLVRFLSATAAALFSTAGFFVHSGPRATLSFFFRDASVFVTFFDLFSLAFCLSVYLDLSPLGILPASLHDRPFCK
jgi:hypothetical protein